MIIRPALFFVRLLSQRQFKRSVVNVSEQIERDRAFGVSNPNTPVWSLERIEPTISEAEEAGLKIMAVNGAAQAAIEAAKNPQLEGQQEPSTPDHAVSGEGVGSGELTSPYPLPPYA